MTSGSLSSSCIGTSEGIPAYTVKVESRIPGKIPPISGCIHLFDASTGSLLALLESSFISSVSSALTGALATDLLAAPRSPVVALVGNGTQGWLGLRFLMEMRELERVNLFDLSRRKSKKVAERLAKYQDLEVKVCDSLVDAVANADIVCCSTWSRQAFLFSDMIKPGAHVSTLGADERGKVELSEELLRSSSFFCDDRDLAVSVGPLHGLSGATKMVAGELGEILSGSIQGRRSSDEVTVYGAVGLPFADLIAAWVVYSQAAKRGVGQPYAMFQ
jgi:ornithine cyclodeaminase